MKLVRVATKNARNLPDAELRLTHPDGRPHDVVLVTGPIASGKTTLLELIAMAKEALASGGRPARPRRFLRQGESHGRVELTLLFDDEERRRAGLGDAVAQLAVELSGTLNDVDPKVAKLLNDVDAPRLAAIDYLPSNRQLTQPLDVELPPSDDDERRMRLWSDPDKYRGILPWLRERLRSGTEQLATRLRQTGIVMSGDTRDGLDDFRRMLAEMCPHLRLAGLATDPNGQLTPYFVRDDGTEAAALELSAAERDAVLLAANAQRLGLSRSLLLIDRPDLHAHPDDQPRWLGALASGDNQIIAATSSEALLSAVPAAQHIRLGHARTR